MLVACHNCGRPCPPNTKTCPSCGSYMNIQTCENCGKKYDEGRTLEAAWEEAKQRIPWINLNNRILICWDCDGSLNQKD